MTFANSAIEMIESLVAAGEPIGVVCHSTGALRHVKTPDGKLLVQGKQVTGFTNGEQEEVGLTKIVPFLVEDEMLRLGAIFSKEANWAPHVVSDGLLITGHSSEPRLLDDPVITSIAKKVNKTPAQVLLAWAVQRGTALLTTSKTSSRIKENFDISRLPEDAMKEISPDWARLAGFVLPFLRSVRERVAKSSGPSLRVNHSAGRKEASGGVREFGLGTPDR